MIVLYCTNHNREIKPSTKPPFLRDRIPFLLQESQPPLLTSKSRQLCSCNSAHLLPQHTAPSSRERRLPSISFRDHYITLVLPTLRQTKRLRPPTHPTSTSTALGLWKISSPSQWPPIPTPTSPATPPKTLTKRPTATAPSIEK